MARAGILSETPAELGEDESRQLIGHQGVALRVPMRVVVEDERPRLRSPEYRRQLDDGVVELRPDLFEEPQVLRVPGWIGAVLPRLGVVRRLTRPPFFASLLVSI